MEKKKSMFAFGIFLPNYLDSLLCLIFAIKAVASLLVVFINVFFDVILDGIRAGKTITDFLF